jgi:transposase
VSWDAFTRISIIGIDEISLKRGQRDFVAIITTKTALGVQVLAVLGDRKKETVCAFLSAIPRHLKQRL